MEPALSNSSHKVKPRSDCFIKVHSLNSAGNIILLQSKVKSLYGDSIRELCHQILNFHGIKKVKVEVEDFGALPFTIGARLETALSREFCLDKHFLFDVLPQNKYTVNRDKSRRSRLYLPGNNPKMMINAGIYGSDAIILDLEDSVAPDKKADARILARNALCQVDFYGAEKMVRINPVSGGLEDLDFIVPFYAHTILIPKCESAGDVHKVDSRIKGLSLDGQPLFLIPIIESALGVEKAFEIASASENVVAMAIGLEDYTADIGAQRTLTGEESFYARSRVVNAARAAGIQPLDSVFSDYEDLEALKVTASESKKMGFEGMGCIHPAQVSVVNEQFLPSPSEIKKAKKIVIAFEKATRAGQGVVAVGSKMVDPPVVKRALKMVENAVQFNLIDKNWKKNYEG